MASPRTSMPDRKKAVSKPTGESPSSARGRASAGPAATAGRRSVRAAGLAGGSGGASPRINIRKTYKLFIGGAFPRSESGRSYPVTGADGTLLAHAARASRKDARDAVKAARSAAGRWSGATAYNRGQVLYRVAEMLEGRAAQFATEIAAGEGVDLPEAEQAVAAAIDRWVWYAGWPDKVAQVAGAANPVAGPFFNFSVPEPTGVVAVVAPAGSSLLGLVSVVAPVIATGNAVVVIASEPRPLPAITLAEVLATSDLPGGVVNVLTGFVAELAPVLAGHMDVNAIDLTGVEPAARAELEVLAAENVKRVFTPAGHGAGADWAAAPGTRRMLAFLETKTVWHPVGI
jgi:acyl-CoA reductase-like NAD-dependent aldehyde dehydrogenase